MGNYAKFLHETSKDMDQAEEYYRRALDADSSHAIILGNYAVFLKNIRKDMDKAEEYYHRALEVDPNHAIILGNYAVFLKDIRKDMDKAEEHYKRSLDVDPNHANNLGNYATLGPTNPERAKVAIRLRLAYKESRSIQTEHVDRQVDMAYGAGASVYALYA